MENQPKPETDWRDYNGFALVRRLTKHLGYIASTMAAYYSQQIGMKRNEFISKRLHGLLFY